MPIEMESVRIRIALNYETMNHINQVDIAHYLIKSGDIVMYRIILDHNTPDEVMEEVYEYFDGQATMSFDWDDEDNECMPLTAAWLASEFNVYKCILILL